MKLSESEWNFINEMTLKIHSSSDERSMRLEFLTLLGTLIKFDSASFYLFFSDGKSGAPVGVGLTDADLNYYIDSLEGMDPFKPLRNLFAEPRHTAIRVSDYCIGADVKDTEYYRAAWEPKGFRYSLFAGLAYSDSPLGSISLYRKEGDSDFSDKDIAIMNILKGHMNIRLWNEAAGKAKSVFPSHHMRGTADRSVARVKSSEAEHLYDLTGRELEVIELWSRGMTDAEICEQLAISRNTLKKHISNIFGKLGISSRVELLKIIPDIAPSK